MRIDVPVTAAAGFDHAATVAAELMLPAKQACPAGLLVCLPGGGMNRHYFDLATPPGETEASFARAMTMHGFAVAVIDPLGVGDSTLPDDPYLLHPDVMAAANAVVVRTILARLHAGTMAEDIPAMPSLRSIGIGHSFGALLTIVQQAADPIHAGVGLLGFQIVGLPEHVAAEHLALNPGEARRRLVALARRRYPEPVLTMTPPPARRAISLAPALDRMLATPALMSLLPGIVAPDAAAIATPVLLALGDGDIHADPHRAPAAYTGSSEVTLLVLRETRHNHFLYPSRRWLFDRVARWAALCLA